MLNEQVKRGALGLAAAVSVGLLSFWLAWKLSVQEPEGPRVASERGKHPVQREPVSVPVAVIEPAGEKLSVAPSAAVLPSAGEPKHVAVDLPTATVTIQPKRFAANQAAVVDPVGQAALQNTVKKEPLPVATALVPAEVTRSPASASAPLALDSGESRAAGLPTALATERSHGQEAPPGPAIIEAKAPVKLAGSSALAVVPAAEPQPSEIDVPQATVPPPGLVAAVVPGRVDTAGTASLASMPAERTEGAQALVTVDASLDHRVGVPRQDAVPMARVGLLSVGENSSLATVAAPDVKSVPSPGTAIFEPPGVVAKTSPGMISAELREASPSSSGADAALAEVADGTGGRAFYTADLSPESHMADSQLQAASVGVRESARSQTAASIASISPSSASAAPLTTAAMNRGAASPVDTGRVEPQSVGEISLALVPPELPSMCMRTLSLAPLAHSWLPVYADAPRGMIPHFQAPEPSIGGDLIPDDPVLVARSYRNADIRLLRWLESWAEELDSDQKDRGQAITDQANTLAELEGLLAQTSLTCTQIYEIGRGVSWVEGEVVATQCSSFAWIGGTNVAAAVLYRAAIRKAETELKALSPEDPSAPPVLHVLSRMSGFWDIRDYVSLEHLFRLLKEYSRPGSLSALSAGFLQAESLYMQGRGTNPTLSLAAAELCRLLLQLTEVDHLSTADRACIHWIMGNALYIPGHYEESLPHLAAAVTLNGKPCSPVAREYYIMTLLRVGQVARAREQYRTWIVQDEPPRPIASQMGRLIAQAEERGSVPP